MVNFDGTTVKFVQIVLGLKSHPGIRFDGMCNRQFDLNFGQRL